MPNQYDKILKENILKLLINSSKVMFGFEVRHYEPIKDKLQSTREREVDFAGIVEIIEEGKMQKIVLHIEFERTFRRMHERMMDYHALLYAKYKLEIRHIVIYIGKAKSPRETGVLPEKHQYKGFYLVRYQKEDIERFLSSDNPETVLLSFLSHIENGVEGVELAKKVQQRLQEICDSDEIYKYQEQFLTLSFDRERYIYVNDDQYNYMPESDETNNWACVQIEVLTQPDLVISMTPSQTVLQPGEQYTVEVLHENLSGAFSTSQNLRTQYVLVDDCNNPQQIFWNSVQTYRILTGESSYSHTEITTAPGIVLPPYLFQPR